MNAKFLKGVVPISLSRLSDLFNGSDTRFTQFKRDKAKAIAALQALQTSKIQALMAGADCKGFEVAWATECSPLKDSTCEAMPTGCGITATTEMEIEKQLYDPKCPLSEEFIVNDNICNNIFSAAEAIAFGLGNAVVNLDARLNRKFYTAMKANATPNTFPDPIGTVVGTHTDVTSGLWTADILVQMAIEAQFTGIKNPIFFDGTNLTVVRALAPYRAFNSNEASGAKIFEDFGGMLVVDDPTDALAATSRKSTFVVDMDGVVMLSKIKDLGDQPVEIDQSLNLYHWSVRSPLTNVLYQVEYQKTCAGRKDGSLEVATNHVFNVRWLGDIYFAPPQCGGVTNVMEYVKIV
jgi:hypothetical protein